MARPRSLRIARCTHSPCFNCISSWLNS
ncbi:hypothetical protein KPG66_08650 [Mycetohabitans sp. B2]|uniref:Zinc finger C3HC4 RING-type domain-containing protein n=1 Tax=Mycetohabitans rhizoxinica TaxID=412963 RepID=A0ABZ2PZS8_9BURK|nr:hypothetical protein [Mycetohabitans sp. B2]